MVLAMIKALKSYEKYWNKWMYKEETINKNG